MQICRVRVELASALAFAFLALVAFTDAADSSAQFESPQQPAVAAEDEEAVARLPCEFARPGGMMQLLCAEEERLLQEDALRAALQETVPEDNDLAMAKRKASFIRFGKRSADFFDRPLKRKASFIRLG